MRGLTEEQEYAEECREALRRMVSGARENVVVGSETWGDRYTAERLGHYLKTLARDIAEEGDNPPYFGLIQYDGNAGEHRGQSYYLGRRHISDAIGRPPMVIDWRAPVSTTFYQATANDSRGLATRRRFGWAANTLTSFEDEQLGSAQAEATGFGSELVRREIERARVGPMRDIVATIQPEQDEVVRTELEVSVCVQGAPGTGKTAVGLHRAAYLLYAHRGRLQRNGVLVLGPNRAFLHYISAVLPTLGEVDVDQTTVEEMLAGRIAVRATDSVAAAVVKHDGRMAEIIRRALYERISEPLEPIVVADSSYKWRVQQYELAEMVTEARAHATAYLMGRERVIARVVASLQRQAEARGQNCNGVWLRKMARAVTPAVDAVWPAVKAEEVLAEILGEHSRLSRAADGLLSPGEQDAIAWPQPRKAKTALWTLADAVLLDELSALLERGETYGHVIVDEAQDLSPMECRAIARRCEHGSVTVLGDLAQGTTPWAARTWADQLGHLGKPEAELVALTTGYRVPASVVELANRLLTALPVEVPQTTSFRTDGQLTITESDDIVDAVQRALPHEGSIGVIAADQRIAVLNNALQSAGIDTVAPGGDGRVTVVPASLAKGLEYDHVIAVEPAEIVEAEPRGLNRLYVILTRAVSRLDVLHTRPLPRELS
ncbi:AAA family ATPase [Kribbella antibiotica]|uniref:AAA family ATPase n=1 Tax=Kribbella antibiotica TaxID=190195 RepID=A0A4R4ZSH4_9ACTN|nr:UvrD-helicase domain-containing protein [Kribbella antibiotica]TDD61196.1 AAA family ATPase [Kribbella antibiotica]